jgi:ribose transport system ATP-binding protein
VGTDTAFDEVLRIEHWTVHHPTQPGRVMVDDASLTVRAGEVVGIAGLVGAGRTEVVRAVFGADPYDSGTVTVSGSTLRAHDVNAAMTAGMGLVPEDRKGQGLVLDASVEENLGLVTLRSATRAGLVDLKGQHTAAARIAEQLGVRMAGLGQHVRTLSGGNQQKVVIGKMLTTNPKVILLDEPSRGIDVGAKAEVFRLLSERAAQGLAVVFSTSEVNECLSIAHRIVVMRRGKISAEFGANATKEQIMAASGEAVVA